MEFSITNEGKVVPNGGFIFYGPHDGFGNGGAPTFSVSLSTDKKTLMRLQDLAENGHQFLSNADSSSC